MISVLQASAWYPPIHLGGTEVYLSSLVRELRALGISSRIIVPLGWSAPGEYEFDGAKVRTFSVNQAPSRAELRGEALDAAMDRFRNFLTEERADIYHQHSWTRGLGPAHLHAAREAGFKTVLTVHTPNFICLRGTMVRFGEDACDGRIDPKVCGACWCHAQGAPEFVARSLSAMAPVVSAALGRMPIGRAATALSARWLGERRMQEYTRSMADVDRVVTVCQWVFDALALNGVAVEKLVLSRQGIDPSFAVEAADAASKRADVSDGVFEVLYIGRWDPVKGVDVLVRAVRTIPAELPLVLSIHGVGTKAEELAYAAHIRGLAAGDRRIAILPAIPRDRLASTLAHASALAVPSLWLETGPLVVLEAKAARLPVIGSRLGGIAELVHEPNEGILVPPGNVTAWASAIKCMAINRPRLPEVTATGIRTMRDVAREMATLYGALCYPDAPTAGAREH
jgi:glycosyltransferase involved in cell wall biosynthesis